VLFLLADAVAAIAIEAEIAIECTPPCLALVVRIRGASLGPVAARLPQLPLWDALAIVAPAAGTAQVLTPVIADLVIIAKRVVMPGLRVVPVLRAVAPWLFLLLLQFFSRNLLGRRLLLVRFGGGPAMVPPLARRPLLETAPILLHVAPEGSMIHERAIGMRDPAVLERDLAAAAVF